MINWIRIQIETWIESRRFNKALERQCPTCEVLKMELAKAHQLNKELREEMFRKPEPVTVIQQAPSITRPHALPWSVKQRELEKESRKQAEELRQKRQAEIDKTMAETPTDTLEKEVLEGKANAV